MRQNLKNILTAMLIILVLLSGFFYYKHVTDKEQFVLPLEEGADFIYTGEYITRSSQKTIRMEAPQHRIVVEREVIVDEKKRWILSFMIGEYKIHRFVLTMDENGLNILMGETRTLAIPAELKRGEKWEFNIGSQMFTGKTGAKRKIKTPAGIFNAREISFQTNTRTRITLWVHDQTGIVALNYSYIQDGSSRSEAELVLTDIKSKND
jgi:hypothetical protein